MTPTAETLSEAPASSPAAQTATAAADAALDPVKPIDTPAPVKKPGFFARLFGLKR